MQYLKQLKQHLGQNFNVQNLKIDLPESSLIEESIQQGTGKLTQKGALVVKTGKFTGRAAKDKYVVFSEKTKHSVWWENNVGKMSLEDFEKLKNKAIAHLESSPFFYMSNRSVGMEEHHVNVTTLTESPSHVLFTKHLFREFQKTVHDEFSSSKDFIVLHAPSMKITPNEFGQKSETVIVTNFETNIIIIVGTHYAGEIKKSLFSVLNFILPTYNVLPMHAGANKNKTNNETSVFFGLSGTGKTTLSTDNGKLLIGDDEHGLSDKGIFNFENGCYAKTIKLSQEAEPGIFKALGQFGALLENVVLKDDKEPDFDDNSLTENGRGSYPLEFIEDRELSAKGGIPKNIFFLTADAYGVLPAISKLTKDQAMFYFVLGYTAKVAGTELGVTEPQKTFSPCFGAPFMLRHPSEYALLLKNYIEKYNINVWLVNTGWTKGPYGEGERYPIKITRSIIRSIQDGKAEKISFEKDPYFKLSIPLELEGVSQEFLRPDLSWKDKIKYENFAKKLCQSFHEQIKKFGDFYELTKEGHPSL